MNIENMKLFVAVYDARSISRAAERLYTTHQAVSKRIKSVEDELGCLLFEREPRGLAPTPAGDAAYRAFSDMLARYNELLASTAEARERRPVVRVCIEFYTSDAVDLSALSTFEAASGAQVDASYCSFGDCYRRINAGRADIALSNRPREEAERYEFCSLQVERSVIITAASSPLASKAIIRPADLAGETVLSVIDAEATNRRIAEICEEEGARPRFEAVSYDMDTLLNMVRNGRGVHVAPERFAHSKATDGGFAIRPFALEVPFFEIGLIQLRNRIRKPAVEDFAAWAEAHAEELIYFR